MLRPTIELYSDIFCPWTYLTVYRLRQIWPDYAGRLRLAWRALSLEYINRAPTALPLVTLELDLIRDVEPTLPAQRWQAPAWQWPITAWPAFEALACAQRQSEAAGFAMNWALRHAVFNESRSPVLRHDILDIARQVARVADLDIVRFEEDWDSGCAKASVLADSRRGWHELKVAGSPTLVLPDGRQFTSPGTGEADIDEAQIVLRSFTPYAGDPLDALRSIFETALASA